MTATLWFRAYTDKVVMPHPDSDEVIRWKKKQRLIMEARDDE